MGSIHMYMFLCDRFATWCLHSGHENLKKKKFTSWKVWGERFCYISVTVYCKDTCVWFGGRLRLYPLIRFVFLSFSLLHHVGACTPLHCKWLLTLPGLNSASVYLGRFLGSFHNCTRAHSQKGFNNWNVIGCCWMRLHDLLVINQALLSGFCPQYAG